MDYSQRFLQETVVGRTQTPQQILGDKDIVLTTNGSSKPPDARQIIEQRRIDSELKEEFESTEKSNESDRYKPQSQPKRRNENQRMPTEHIQRINAPPFAFSLLEESPPIWNILNIKQNSKKNIWRFLKMMKVIMLLD